MGTSRNLQEEFIKNLVYLDIITPEIFLAFQRKFAKLNRVSFFNKDELLKVYQKLIRNGIVSKSPSLDQILKMKNVRSQSGIAVVSVLTKTFPCPGACIYCPTEENVPKSYLSSEPAVMRAISNSYHPYKQVASRLRALRDTGHITDKISIRIIGGTWSAYPRIYRNWFIRQLFKACNEFGGDEILGESLSSLQTVNENSHNRVVELSVETRQDCVTEHELMSLRKFGVTKVELGVQSLDDKILRSNKRGSSNEETIRATELLKNFGFKVSYQMMLNLYKSTPKRDIEIFKEMFDSEDYRPDHLKIYPLALVKNSGLYQHYLNHKFKPYNKDELIETISDIKANIPEYCRVERVIRDIPATEIVEGGAKISNLRQEIEKHMKTKGQRCPCIRCREIKGRTASTISLEVSRYSASSGEEYFIQSVDDKGQLIGFCRLRLNNNKLEDAFLRKLALIREIHVYGPTVSIGKAPDKEQQHRGLGKQMVAKAEEIAREEGYAKMAVIAGIGVRNYFIKLGYNLDNTYMLKSLPGS